MAYTGDRKCVAGGYPAAIRISHVQMPMEGRHQRKKKNRQHRYMLMLEFNSRRGHHKALYLIQRIDIYPRCRTSAIYFILYKPATAIPLNEPAPTTDSPAPSPSQRPNTSIQFPTDYLMGALPPSLQRPKSTAPGYSPPWLSRAWYSTGRR